jgi:hypothetical protein
MKIEVLLLLVLFFLTVTDLLTTYYGVCFLGIIEANASMTINFVYKYGFLITSILKIIWVILPTAIIYFTVNYYKKTFSKIKYLKEFIIVFVFLINAFPLLVVDINNILVLYHFHNLLFSSNINVTEVSKATARIINEPEPKGKYIEEFNFKAFCKLYI